MEYKQWLPHEISFSWFINFQNGTDYILHPFPLQQINFQNGTNYIVNPFPSQKSLKNITAFYPQDLKGSYNRLSYRRFEKKGI